MKYSFPQINHLNDVLPAIAGRDEFIVAEKDGYKVVNYAVMMEDSFPPVETAGGSKKMREEASRNKAIRRECRGLVFNEAGELINRRYHKFFNVNERDETRFEKVDFTQPHVILEKLDGSMVSPCYVKGNVRWMTKMGITDTSMEAEVHVAKNPQYVTFAEECLKDGWTPVFEWCSNKNRIVLAYPEDQLVLTAVRENATGYYARVELLEAYGRNHNIPVVKSYDFKAENILEVVRAMEDAEGVVVRFFDGHMLKVKADWYVLRHKSKDAITREKNVLDYIVNERVDDVLPFLEAADQAQLMKFQDTFWKGVNALAATYEAYLKDLRLDRKEWAMTELPEMRKADPHVGSVVFGWYDGRDVKETLVNIIRKNIGTQAKINENRYLWGGAGWRYSFDGDV
jgi:RNA ligase